MHYRPRVERSTASRVLWTLGQMVRNSIEIRREDSGVYVRKAGKIFPFPVQLKYTRIFSFSRQFSFFEGNSQI